MRETFKKSDLKTGMIVECRNGDKYTVMLDTVMTYDSSNDILINVEKNGEWTCLGHYTNDLKHSYINFLGNRSEYKEFDIVKVYLPSHCNSFVASSKLNASYCVTDKMLIWERKEKTDFLDDKDAMIDFLALSKDAFLFSHYCYTEEMYDNTYALVEEKLGLR